MQAEQVRPVREVSRQQLIVPFALVRIDQVDDVLPDLVGGWLLGFMGAGLASGALHRRPLLVLGTAADLCCSAAREILRRVRKCSLFPKPIRRKNAAGFELNVVVREKCLIEKT
jgi:hypothetical protein